MKLVVFELQDELFQEVTPDKDTEVRAIRPRLLKYGNFNGQISIQVRDENNQLIATSNNSLTALEMSEENYAHKYYRFFINVSLKKNTIYRVVLTSSDEYTFSESSYVGWINSYDLTSYSASYSDSEGLKAPLAMEIWERK